MIVTFVMRIWHGNIMQKARIIFNVELRHTEPSNVTPLIQPSHYLLRVSVAATTLLYHESPPAVTHPANVTIKLSTLTSQPSSSSSSSSSSSLLIDYPNILHYIINAISANPEPIWRGIWPPPPPHIFA